MTNKTIFSAQTTNGSSTTFKAVGDLNGSANKDVIGDLNGAIKIYSFLTIYGTFAGATLTLKYKAADGNWYPTGDVSITDSCSYFIEISPNVEYRLDLAGATGTTSISSTVYNVV